MLFSFSPGAGTWACHSLCSPAVAEPRQAVRTASSAPSPRRRENYRGAPAPRCPGPEHPTQAPSPASEAAGRTPPTQPRAMPEARQRQLDRRNIAAPHLAAFQPVTGIPALVLAQHRRAFLPQAFQIRHRVRISVPANPLTSAMICAPCLPASASAPPAGFPSRFRTRSKASVANTNRNHQPNWVTLGEGVAQLF